MRVLVCGGREYANRKRLRSALSDMHKEAPISVVIAGGAPGADRLAEEWARHYGVPAIRMEANWTRYGKKAGPIRNQWMIDLCSPEVVVAFPGGFGTTDMIRRARSANIKVIEVDGWRS
ncbi:conserved hypothetical protein [Hyphomicrobiales bacterium]|nr:conserved hypothetical protein [Hyphomicrobiales bacterium]CAH1668667.1 conserved hypothetical protein [Hyphomicrobiales bacterium]